jgi:hypothetical protein
MLREPLVDERVVRPQQIQHAPVFPQDALEEELGFPPEGVPQILVEVREQPHVRRDRIEVAQVQPLRCEIRDQRFSARVREHATHLALENHRFAKPARDRQVQQLVVRDAAPQKK